jgi:hypothetical protein
VLVEHSKSIEFVKEKENHVVESEYYREWVSGEVGSSLE